MSSDPRAASFDRKAAEYERARPGYPAQLFDRVLSFARLPAGARLLEVGVGTGKATVPFAERGFRILGLEPGRNLGDIARARLASFRGVEVRTVSFEDWKVEAAAFDLAYVAQAFHWLAPEQRLSKLAAALRSAGALAIFGNAGAVAAGPMYDAIQVAYREHGPELRSRDHSASWYAAPDGVLAELAASPLFTDVEQHLFTWSRVFTSAGYCELIATYSDHAMLPPDRRSALLAAVADAIDQRGGSVSIDFATGLSLARVAA